MSIGTFKKQNPRCIWSREDNLNEFAGLRLGIFIHFGLSSMLGRGEWVLNRENLPIEEYKALADKFEPSEFNAEKIVKLIYNAGAKYVVFTTMHHDGFALYDSKLNSFNSVKYGSGRNLVKEVVQACRKYNLRIHLYHSLNNWTADPDAVNALEQKSNYKTFIANVHERIRELVTIFNPIDCLWYDGWWPFNAEGWKAEEMNKMVRKIQPHIIFNGRNGLPGDFATPEQHMSAPQPWRPWEACITHNRHWGYHKGDNVFKSSDEIIDLLTIAATGAGNLLINIGPDGKGRIPEPSKQLLNDLGRWTETNSEAIYETEPFTMDLRERGSHRGDFFSHGRYSVKGNVLYLHLLSWPGKTFSIAGLECSALKCKLLGSEARIKLSQTGKRLTFDNLPQTPPLPWGGVLAVECDRKPVIYWTAGMRIPKVDHPRYDPCESDIIQP
jgi:alpha-L-fucosidase